MDEKMRKKKTIERIKERYRCYRCRHRATSFMYGFALCRTHLHEEMQTRISLPKKGVVVD